MSLKSPRFGVFPNPDDSNPDMKTQHNLWQVDSNPDMKTQHNLWQVVSIISIKAIIFLLQFNVPLLCHESLG
ncbi:hypothetical protein T06_3742 [Trichinella sp. T6]|nr:hypothetical protein T06_3742 [Trichinella sp. T6]